MPIYEYECEKCGHRFEKIRKFSDPPLETCPKCQGALHKLQSAPAFQFKGTGWYVTDYARGDSKGGGKSESKEPKPDSETKSEPAKTESASSTPASSKSETKSGD